MDDLIPYAVLKFLSIKLPGMTAIASPVKEHERGSEPLNIGFKMYHNFWLTESSHAPALRDYELDANDQIQYWYCSFKGNMPCLWKNIWHLYIYMWYKYANLGNSG